MRSTIFAARVLAGAAAIGIATAGFAQDAPAARADGYAELERLPGWSGVWTLGVAGGYRISEPAADLAVQAQAVRDQSARWRTALLKHGPVVVAGLRRRRRVRDTHLIGHQTVLSRLNGVETITLTLLRHTCDLRRAAEARFLRAHP